MMKYLRKIIINHMPNSIFIPVINLNNKFKKRAGRVKQFNNSIYVVSDGKKQAYSARRRRLRRYFWDIKRQCEELAETYLLHNIQFQTGDIFIDCGANNGELGIWANDKGLKYYAFEPEDLESECCDLNNYNGKKKTIRKGLWFEKTTIHWHSKPDTADSSIIEMAETDEVKSIETTTLNDFVQEETIENIRLLKLEAEGAEPEVLKGSLNILKNIDYIAVDCGYERGIEKNHTFMEVYKILSDHKFEIVAAEFKRVVFLFKRSDVKN